MCGTPRLRDECLAEHDKSLLERAFPREKTNMGGLAFIPPPDSYEFTERTGFALNQEGILYFKWTPDDERGHRLRVEFDSTRFMGIVYAKALDARSLKLVLTRSRPHECQFTFVEEQDTEAIAQLINNAILQVAQKGWHVLQRDGECRERLDWADQNIPEELREAVRQREEIKWRTEQLEKDRAGWHVKKEDGRIAIYSGKDWVPAVNMSPQAAKQLAEEILDKARE